MGCKNGHNFSQSLTRDEWETIEKVLQKIEDEEDTQEALLALKEIEEHGCFI